MRAQLFDNTQLNDLRLFGRYMSDQTSRSLDLLRDIENTVFAVGRIAAEADDFYCAFVAMTAGVTHFTDPFPHDLENEFGVTQERLEALHHGMQRRRESAVRDARLNDDDGVCDVYARAIESVDRLHGCIEDLRWSIMSHNAIHDGSDPGPELTTADDVGAFLSRL